MNTPTGTEAKVCEDIARRQRFGMGKYSVTVADNPLDLRQWLNHAYEESLDQSVYLKRAMEEMNDLSAYKDLAIRLGAIVEYIQDFFPTKDALDALKELEAIRKPNLPA